MSGWLTVHLLGVLLFLGNIVTAAFWKTRADLTNNPKVIHEAVRNVMLADYVFTLPGLILIVVSGSLMAAEAQMPMSGFNWLTLSLILFAFTGVIWLAILLPVQRAMIRHSAAGVESGSISPAYRKASLNWTVFGIAATLLPLAILYLMISQSF